MNKPADCAPVTSRQPNQVEPPYYPLDPGWETARDLFVVLDICGLRLPRLLLECAHFVMKELPRLVRKRAKRIRAKQDLRESTIATLGRRMTDAELDEALAFDAFDAHKRTTD